MEENAVSKKRIKYTSDYANLFLAAYTLKTKNDIDDKIYLPLNFETIFEYIFDVALTDYAYEMGINSEEHNIDLNEFLSKLKVSTVKKYWRSDFIFDFDKNAIMVEVDAKNAMDEINKYDDLSIQFINTILDLFTTLDLIDITESDMKNLKQKQSDIKDYKYIFKSED